ncbi:MAG: hypothetical protein IPK58_05290 [Acidobacteria bacterium]|nr:hypothetical protein [Acidobacteriota bacterium]
MTKLLLNIGVLILVAGPILCFSQAPRPISEFRLKPTDLLKTRPDIEIKDLRVTIPDEALPLGRVLYRLAFQTGIPIGLEIADSDEREAFEYDPELLLIASGDRAGWVVAGDTMGWKSEPIRSFSLKADR